MYPLHIALLRLVFNLVTPNLNLFLPRFCKRELQFKNLIDLWLFLFRRPEILLNTTEFSQSSMDAESTGKLFQWLRTLVRPVVFLLLASALSIMSSTQLSAGCSFLRVAIREREICLIKGSFPKGMEFAYRVAPSASKSVTLI